MRKPNIKKMQQTCDAFNATNPIGSAVTVKLDGVNEPLETVTRSEAQILSGHSAVIWLEGVSGCYLLDRVTPKTQAQVQVQESSMKIFQMNDCDWLIGASIEECKAECCDQLDPNHEAHELSDSELDTLIFTVTDENEVPSGIKRTFREQLAIEISAGGKFPRLFACTEF